MARVDTVALTVAEAARLVRSRKLSPVELVEASLRRVEALDRRLRAFITVLGDQAMAEARKAEAEIGAGNYKGPLHGIPISLKDLFYTRGVLTTAGTGAFDDFVPNYDATVTAKLKEAGAIVIGKNNLHELAVGGTGENPFFGNGQNPWKEGYVPGGSSSGSAIAVATGMGLASMGSDTGGSIRIPASFSGVVGHKPTYGLVSRYGVFALSWTLDHVGPLTKTVEDAAIVLTAVAGYDARDSGSAQVRRRNYVRSLRGDVKGLRLGIPLDPFFEVLDKEVRQAVSQAVRVMRGMGCTTRRVSLPTAAYSQEIGLAISWAETASIYESELRARFHRFSRAVQDQILVGLSMPSSVYVKAQMARAVAQREFHRALEQVDLIVMPTTAVPAFPIGSKQVQLGGESVEARFLPARLTRPSNQTGYPALSVPCGFTREGLPVGLQIIGRPFEDGLVLRLGHAYQQATEWHKRNQQL
ncbi:MAG: amidase [Chloroflexi bacterium]|nr:amidase [Chloroflexota bacterium]